MKFLKRVFGSAMPVPVEDNDVGVLPDAVMDYHAHFGFTRAPFDLTPDPGLLVLNRTHEEALDKLYRGVMAGRGICVLTGEVGTGKTIILHTLMGTLDERYRIAYLFHTNMATEDLIAYAAQELSDEPLPPHERNVSGLVATIQRLAERGLRPLIIVDEAHHLSPQTFETFRMLSNFETPGAKLIQFVFAGQLELEAVLDDPEMRQVKQRISVRHRLEQLNYAEMCRYLTRRCKQAGRDRLPFDAQLLIYVYAISKGNPRVVNVLCDGVLMNAFVEGRHRPGLQDLKKVKTDLAL